MDENDAPSQRTEPNIACTLTLCALVVGGLLLKRLLGAGCAHGVRHSVEVGHHKIRCDEHT